MKPVLNNVLCINNCHSRDKHIKFFEEEHKYVIDLEPDVKYTSVTSFVHEHFEKFESDKIIEKMMKGKSWKEGHKYWGMTPETIKKQWEDNKNSVSSAGTDLHYEIECFYNNPLINQYTNKDLYNNYLTITTKTNGQSSIEWQYFMNFVKDFPDLKPYRTEWTVFNEDLKISGSIDMTFENVDGTLSIYDWKRSKNISKINTFNKFATTQSICHLPDSNYWHYALQLNIYKFILESKYDKKVSELYLVRLHPDAEEKNYDLIKLPILNWEMNELMEERLKNINEEYINKSI
jgi:ATP-dependent exoDNAse (exonuclease V) beta subunit